MRMKTSSVQWMLFWLWLLSFNSIAFCFWIGSLLLLNKKGV